MHKAERVFLLLKSYRLLCPEAHSMLRPLSESEIILARNCHTYNQPLYWRVRPLSGPKRCQEEEQVNNHGDCNPSPN